MRRLFGTLAVTAALVTGCDPVGPVDNEPSRQNLLTNEEQEITFARLADTVQVALGLENGVQDTSFWAVPGQDRSLIIRYQNQDGSPGSTLLEFQVGALSLLTLPTDLPVPADSVEITVRIRPDPQRRFIFDFEPSGLTFNPFDPARLRVNPAGADPDVNGDQVTDQLDQQLRQQFRIWRQDVPGLLWERLPTEMLPRSDVVDGRVLHFTGFAMAS